MMWLSIYPSAVAWLNSLALLCQTAAGLIENAIADGSKYANMEVWKLLFISIYVNVTLNFGSVKVLKNNQMHLF